MSVGQKDIETKLVEKARQQEELIARVKREEERGAMRLQRRHEEEQRQAKDLDPSRVDPALVEEQRRIEQANQARFNAEKEKRQKLIRQQEQEAEEAFRQAIAESLKSSSASSSSSSSSVTALSLTTPSVVSIAVPTSANVGAPITPHLALHKQPLSDREKKEQWEDQVSMILSRLKVEAGYEPSSDIVVKAALLKRIKKITEASVNGITLLAAFAQDSASEKGSASYEPLLAAVQKLAGIEDAKAKAKKRC